VLSSWHKISVVSIATVLFLSGCVQPEAPSITYQGVHVSYSSFTTFDIAARFSVRNPNPLPLSGRASYRVTLAGKELFKGRSGELDITARGRSDLYLVNRIDALKIFSSIGEMIAIIKNGETTIPLEVAGDFNVTLKGGFLNFPVSAPFHYQGQIELPRLPRINLKGVRLVDFDLQKVRLKISTIIQNENNFALNLQELAYSLMHQGDNIFSSHFDAPVAVSLHGQVEKDLIIDINLDQIDFNLLNSLKDGSAQLRMEEEIKSIK